MVSCTERKESVSIVPSPSGIEFSRGSFFFGPETVFSVENEQQLSVALWFAGLFAESAGFVPQVVVSDKDADLILVTDSSMAKDSYRLNVTRRSVRIEASGESGFFYAFQTLRFALPSAIHESDCAEDVEWKVPVMRVEDSPRYTHRCLKLDVTDHYIPVEEILDFMDCMAMLKLNHLHLCVETDSSSPYSSEDIGDIIAAGAQKHVNVVLADKAFSDLYSCPDDIASRMFPNVAALAEVAWSENGIADKIHFNKAMDILNAHLDTIGFGYSQSIYNVGLADLR